MGIKNLLDDIRFSVKYDAEKMAKKNEEKYGSNLPDCCRVNREANEKAAAGGKK